MLCAPCDNEGGVLALWSVKGIVECYHREMNGARAQYGGIGAIRNEPGEGWGRG